MFKSSGPWKLPIRDARRSKFSPHSRGGNRVQVQYQRNARRREAFRAALEIPFRPGAKREIEVFTKTPAKELISNVHGEILGLMAEREGKTVSIKARQGGDPTCGGYENDPRMKWDYLPVKPAIF